MCHERVGYMVSTIQEKITRVLLVAPSTKYHALLLKALGEETRVNVELVHELDSFETALRSTHWDAVVVMYSISPEPIRVMEAGEWEIPLIILCDTQAEADKAYLLTSPRINDVVTKQQLKRVQLILRREANRRIGCEEASELARQKSVNESLQRGEARFRSVIEGFSDPILFVDNFQIIRYANSAFTNVFDYPLSAVLGKPFQTFVGAGEASTIQAKLNDILQTPNAIHGPSIVTSILTAALGFRPSYIGDEATARRLAIQE